MPSGIIDNTTPVDRALAAVREGLSELITAAKDGGLDHYDPSGLLELITETEQIRNRLQAFDVDLIATCRDRDVAQKSCRRTMVRVLEHQCRISPAEAGRRVRAADAAGPRQTMTGLPLPRLRGYLADAMATGSINPTQVGTMCRALYDIERAGQDPDKVAAIEAEMIGYAARFGPKEFERICRRYTDIYDPDGTEPDEQANHDQRFFHYRRTRTGAFKGEFQLTGSAGAQLAAVLEPLAKPRVSDSAAGTTAAAELKDTRTRGQRLHDALEDAFSRLLRSGDLPDSGGTPASVIITIDSNDLLAHLNNCHSGHSPAWSRPARTPASGNGTDETDSSDTWHEADQICEAENVAQTASVPIEPIEIEPIEGEVGKSVAPPGIGIRRTRSGHGITSYGTTMSIPELLRLAGESEIYPVVMTSHGILLDMGRSRRIATKHQAIALIARDGGCSFPSCDHPPEYCERHHIVSWLEGGETKIANLTLLCRYHHHNFLSCGWTVKINSDGLPEWTPPRWIDRDQQPMINNRILARIHQTSLIR